MELKKAKALQLDKTCSNVFMFDGPTVILIKELTVYEQHHFYIKHLVRFSGVDEYVW